MLKLHDAFFAALQSKDRFAVYRAVGLIVGDKCAAELAAAGEYAAPLM